MFASREDAGQKLGRYLLKEQINADLVLGLPRGGVVVAFEVARQLGLSLDVLIVRKIGHPSQREFAVGALAEPDVVILDETVVGTNSVIRMELKGVIEEEKERLQSYRRHFHLHGPPVLEGKVIIIVDDGLATGATTEAAVLSAREQEARAVLVAAPVASISAVHRLESVADQLIILWVDPEFDAVGRYYKEFSQTSDEEVVELLEKARG